MRGLEHRIPPPVVAACLALAMWGAAGLAPTPQAPFSLRLMLVVVFAGAGIAFDVAGVLSFRASRTTVNPLRPERASALVTQGVYRITRNPMYVGMACLLLAWAAWLWQILPLAGPVVFVLYITRFQILPEERALQALFGTGYADYCARVRRWL